MRFWPKAGGQKGVTMLELALASLIIGFTLLVALRTFRIVLKGQQVAKSSQRADNLLVSSLEDLKNAATRASYDGTWSSVTYSPLAISFTTATIVSVGGQQYTIQVIPEWVNIHSATLTPVTTPTIAQLPVSATSTYLLRFWGKVSWDDHYGSAKAISKTAYASYLRQ